MGLEHGLECSWEIHLAALSPKQSLAQMLSGSIATLIIQNPVKQPDSHTPQQLCRQVVSLIVSQPYR
jgi:hypothetical protein